MGFEGSLDIVSFADILNTLCKLEKEGTLTVTDKKRQKIIHFRNNGVTLIREKGSVSLLGDILIRSGKIQQRELESALNEQKETGGLLGEILVAQGVINEEEIEEILCNQIEEEICDIYFWENARFSFKEGPLDEDNLKGEQATLSFDVQSLLFRIAGDLSEWAEIRKAIPSFSIIYIPNEDADAEIEVEDQKIADALEKITPLLDGVNDINSIIRLTQMPVLQVCRTLYELIIKRLLREPDINEILQIAEEFYKKGQTQKYINFLERAIKLNENNQEVLLKIAQAYESISNNQCASTYYCRLAELVLQENISQSLAFYEKAFIHNSRDYKIVENIVNILKDLDNKAKEKKYTKKLTELYLDKKLYDECTELCENYLENYPKDQDVLNVLINVYIEKDEIAKASRQYKKLAYVYKNMGNNISYCSNLKRALDLNPADLELNKEIKHIEWQVKWEKRKYIYLSVVFIAILGISSLLYWLYYNYSASIIYKRALVLYNNNLKYNQAKELFLKVKNNYPLSGSAKDAEKYISQIDKHFMAEQKKIKENKKAKFEFLKERLKSIKRMIDLEKYEQAKNLLTKYNSKYFPKDLKKEISKLEKLIEDRKKGDIRKKLEERFNYAKTLLANGEVEKARGILKDLSTYPGYKEKTKVLLSNFENVFLRESTKQIRKVMHNAMKKRAEGKFEEAIELYKLIIKRINKITLLCKNLNKSEYRYEINSYNQLAIKEKNDLEKLEFKAKLELTEARDLWYNGQHKKAFDKIKKILSSKLKNTTSGVDAKLPFRIESKPAGARVEGTNKQTPCDVWIPNSENKIVYLKHNGFERCKVDLSEKKSPYVKVMLDKIVLWSLNTGGPIWSKVEINKNLLAVTSRSGKAYLLNKKTGSILWDYQAFSDIVGGATIFKRNILFGSNDGYFYVLDLNSGNRKWKKKVDGFIQVKPIIAGGNTIFTTTSGKVYCVNVSERKEIWSYKVYGSIKSSPVIWKRLVIFADNKGTVTALNFLNKQKVHTWKLKGSVISPLLVSGDELFVGTMYGQFYLIDLQKNTIRWNVKLKGSINSAPKLFRKNIYIGTSAGYLYCISRLYGNIIWEKNISKGIYGAPATDYETIYVGGIGGFFYILDNKSGKELWKKKYSENGIYSDIVVDESGVYFGTEEGKLFKISK